MSSESDSDSTKFEKDYDSDAFSYFALSLLATVLIPWTASKLWNLYTKSKDSRNYEKNTQAAQSKNSYFSEEVEEAEKRKRAWSIKDLSVSEWVFYGLWFLLLITLLTLPTAQKAARKCVPYDVLGLEVGVSERQIYQKWKKLSLKYHPDKNPGNETAAELFVNITKAKDTLMDETMRRNCEEYDNPDGPVQTKFQWALPSFFLKFPLSTLIVYLLGIVVGLPMLVWRWWKRAKKIGPNGIFHRTLQLYHHIMDVSFVNFDITSFIILYAASAEFEEDLVKIAHKKYGREWRTLVMVLNKKCGKIQIPAPPPVDRNGNRRVHVSDLFGKNPLTQYGTFLLWAHLHRLKLPKAFQPVLKKMLLKSDKLIPAMLQPILRNPYLPPLGQICLNILRFQQMLVQAMWQDDPIIRQLPYDYDKDFKKRMRKVTSWKVFRGYPEKKKNTIFEKIPEDKAKLMKAYMLETMPQVDLSYNIHVDGESNIIQGDLVTVSVQMYRGVDAPKSDKKGICLNDLPASDLFEEKGGGKGKEAKEKDNDDDDIDGRSNYDDDDDDDSEREDDLLDTLDFVDDSESDGKKKKKKGDEEEEGQGGSYITEAMFYPEEREESWFCVLTVILENAEPSTKERVLDIKKVRFQRGVIEPVEKDLQFPCQLGGTGKFKFRLHLISNTYMGVDIQRDFEIIVGEREAAQEGEEGEEDDEHVEGREQSFLEGLLAYEDGAWGPWYYLWYPNLCALVVDMIALALLAMFIFNFLFSRGYWQDYVSPVIEMVGNSTVFNQGFSKLQSLFGVPEDASGLEDEL